MTDLAINGEGLQDKLIQKETVEKDKLEKEKLNEEIIDEDNDEMTMDPNEDPAEESKNEFP